MNLYQYKAEVDRVVDGDTYDLLVDLGFNTTKKIRIRLRDVDTNEVYGVKKESEEYKKGKEQSNFVKSIFNETNEVIVQTYKDDETGKYGRYLANVIVDGDKISDLLVKNFEELRS